MYTLLAYALYVAIAVCLGIICFAIACAALLAQETLRLLQILPARLARRLRKPVEKLEPSKEANASLRAGPTS